MLVEVEGNEDVLVQIVTHLAARAVQAVPPGVRPVLDLRLQVEDKRVRLHVRSNGEDVVLEEQGFRLVRLALGRMGAAAGADASSDEGCDLWVDLPRAAVRASI
ncbi:MAG: hypothetical protein HYU60_02360 [Magnetospirillum sp.]|nr:hypothetical protein [Magnetospirillum sp.]